MIFGRLTVLHRANVKKGSNVHWVCQCECGKIKTVSGDSLRRGLTKSCGCLQKEISTQTGRNSFVDLRGKRFGKLIVLSDTGRRHGKNIIWHCRCDCGNYTDVPGGGLQSGNTSSCGHCNLKSNGETKIMNILNENNISYVHETSLFECRYPDTGGLARFDFYVSNSYVIEYDGIQHFSAERGNWGDPTYISTQKSHDLYKNKWCFENNIPIIRIPYTHYDDLCLEDLLIETSPFLLSETKGR